MKEILFNYNNLTKDEIIETVIRTKVLILNKNNEILLGYCDKTYQFHGGHLEEGETLIECLKRETQEETGIILKETQINPFLVTRYYNKDYPSKGKNRASEIYNYAILTDEKYNLDNTNYDDGEIKGNYELKYIKMEDVEKNYLFTT